MFNPHVYTFLQNTQVCCLIPMSSRWNHVKSQYHPCVCVCVCGLLKYLRRGDTKGSCVTGDAGDHSVRKPTCDRALFCSGRAWNWTFIAERRDLDPKREHTTMSMVAHHLVHVNSHLEVYIVNCQTHASCGEKNTVSVSTNSNVSFCGTYGCSNLSLSSHRWVLGKWMSKNPNFKSNDDDDDEEEDDDDVDDDDGDDDETLRRGCCVKRLTDSPGIWREFPLRGEGGVPFSWSFRDKGSSPPLCFAK